MPITTLRRTLKLAGSLDLSLVLIGLLTLSVIAGGTLPQASRMSGAEYEAWHNAQPQLAALFDWSGLSAVFSSRWFYGLCLMLLVNLAAGIALHVSFLVAWLRAGIAPNRRMSGPGEPPENIIRSLDMTTLPGSGSRIHTRGVAGLFGTPLFHAGILVIVAGTMLSASERFGAHFELSEGEVFSGEPDKLFIDAFSTMTPEKFGALRLNRLDAQVAEEKHLRELQAFFTVQEQDGVLQERVLSVNHPLSVGGYAFYLDQKFGYTAIFERTLPDSRQLELRINLNAPKNKWNTGDTIAREAAITLEDTTATYRMALTPGNPPRFGLVASQGGKPLFDGVLLPGQSADLGIYRLAFTGVVPWAGLYMTTDRALYVVLAGFVIALAGFLLHLLVRPRRLRLVRTQAGWELEAWVMRDDWLFERQWHRWEARAKRQEE